MGKIKVYKAKVKIRPNGPGTQALEDRYVMRPVRYTTIDVQDLADHIAADSRIERSKISVITDSLIKQIEEMVLNGHKIQIPHLGSFKPRIKSQQAFTADDVDATTFIAKVAFNPSTEMKLELQSTKFETVEQASQMQPQYEKPTDLEVRQMIAAALVDHYEGLGIDGITAEDFELSTADEGEEFSGVQDFYFTYIGQDQHMDPYNTTWISCDGNTILGGKYERVPGVNIVAKDSAFIMPNGPIEDYNIVKVAKFKAEVFNGAPIVLQ